MEVYYSFLCAMCTWTLFCDGLNYEALKRPHKTDKEAAVKSILSYKLLIVSRGVYNHPGYPQCVCSRLKSVGQLKYNHNLTYLDTDEKVPTVHEKRVYRDAIYTVKREQSKVRLYIHAYTSKQHEDMKMSGMYDVLYANKECFIAGTLLPSDKLTAVNQIPSSPKDNAACLLWRKLNAGKRSRHRCRAAFKKRCAKYGKYRFVFTREACLKKRMTKVSDPGAVGLN
nr:uncharacterized protein LOC119180048 [Rhipicephalus microplus]